MSENKRNCVPWAKGKMVCVGCTIPPESEVVPEEPYTVQGFGIVGVVDKAIERMMAEKESTDPDSK